MTTRSLFGLFLIFIIQGIQLDPMELTIDLVSLFVCSNSTDDLLSLLYRVLPSQVVCLQVRCVKNVSKFTDCTICVITEGRLFSGIFQIYNKDNC